MRESIPVRCRFAPSPTGYLHVGSAQSALFNWLFARGTGGEFLLRVEDTDADRNRPELTDNILESLGWLGIGWDGPVVHQSDRGDRHREVIGQLAESPWAYWCDCTREDVERRNRAAGRAPGYDGFCRDRGLPAGEGRALRFRTPDDGTTSWVDVVRGEIRFENRRIEDFVVARSDGSPLFVTANTIDDADMGITHVIRGEDHVNNTAKYLLLWHAVFTRPIPTFAHLPLLVNEQRKKLSKRRDDVSVAEFRAQGYLGEAMRNYLALLGWAPRDGVEIRPIEEIVDQFRLEDVSASSAFFDVRKLRHVNGQYIRALSKERFVELAAPFLPPGDAARAALDELAPLVQERVQVLAEVPGMLAFLWEPHFAVPEEVRARLHDDEAAQAMLRAAGNDLRDAVWDADGIARSVANAAVRAGIVNADGQPRLSKAQAPLRLALTGSRVGLPLWQSMAALGRDETIARLDAVSGERTSAAGGDRLTGS